jgi:hypothetical protein
VAAADRLDKRAWDLTIRLCANTAQRVGWIGIGGTIEKAQLLASASCSLRMAQFCDAETPAVMARLMVALRRSQICIDLGKYLSTISQKRIVSLDNTFVRLKANGKKA